MEIIKILKESFLFKQLSDETLRETVLSEQSSIVSFKRGESVYSSESPNKAVGIILSGRCEIRIDRKNHSKTVLNVLGESDSFGILSIYSAEDFPTQVYATKNSQIIFFSDEQIRYFVNNSSQISQNLIEFLANRISFLNKKITAFSAPRVEERLAVFLLCEYDGKKSDQLSFNCQKAAENINAGRASVYRALDSLEKAGLIKFDNKKIIILDRTGLERISK